MRHPWMGVMAALLIGAALAGTQNAGQLSIDVQEVSVNVYVDDASRKPITTLSREDFSVFEDGKPREISNFASAETPYNILLLFDRSSSTQSQWRFLLSAISRFITQ